MNPLYLRKTDTNECFAFNPQLAARSDMIAWIGPLPWEKSVEAVAAPKAAIAIDLKKEPATDASTQSDDKKSEEFQCGTCGFVAKHKLGLAAHARVHKR